MVLIRTARFFPMESASSGNRVLLFGTFDPLHEGHRYLFRQARALGGALTVVVARDIAIAEQKHRPAFSNEHDRLASVADDISVDTAILGDNNPDSYEILIAADFNILALGYDQKPDDVQVRATLDSLGLEHIRIVRIPAYRPDTYKSSFYRK